MIQRFKKIFTSFLVIAALFAPLAMPAVVSAADCTSGSSQSVKECLSAGACLNTNSASCPSSANPNGSINRLLTTVINIFSLVVGIIAVIMIIIGGIRFVLSGGDSANVTSARNSILYAIVGLVIVALAQVIVHFVLARISS